MARKERFMAGVLNQWATPRCMKSVEIICLGLSFVVKERFGEIGCGMKVKTFFWSSLI